jgi:hypothetical protein
LLGLHELAPRPELDTTPFKTSIVT